MELYDKLMLKLCRRKGDISKECNLDIEEAALIHKVMGKMKGKLRDYIILKFK